MNDVLLNIYKDAVALLHRLTTPNGILASTIEADNYKRIWARDSIVCGVAGILIDDRIIIDGLKNSLVSLAKHQHESGMIPSNVLPDSAGDVSYGSLVGRVDTNTWFIVGACLYYLTTSDEETWNSLNPAVRKCRDYLKAIEFNGKGWIYTPLSGNWADEYPIHGYTLYDNALRIWGEKMWLKISGEANPEFDNLQQRTWTNFWPTPLADNKLIYQKSAFERALSKDPEHFSAFILPGLYDHRFDAAGNGLSLLLNNINQEQKDRLKYFMKGLETEIGAKLIPAFWPIISASSPDWNLLEGNYSFHFKNQPGHFHNGGIWPVWMGLFCLGLATNDLRSEAKEIVNEFVKIVSESHNWDFNEFINSSDQALGGKTQMGYTASGIVFMFAALQGISVSEKLYV